MNLLSTFVHGYNGEFKPKGKLPSLVLDDGNVHVFNYEFPRNPKEFGTSSLPIRGEEPLSTARNFEALPRFGFTGLSITNEAIYCGSWNGVYKLDPTKLECESFITHRLMNDLHGISVSDNVIYTMLTGKDTVVMTTLEGEVLKTFTIDESLNVIKDAEQLREHDWRFLSKQFRGATGLFHFNHVQVLGPEIWLTSRNLGCFVVIDTLKETAHLRTINQKTVVLLHDGIFKQGAYYFTSIDGKILISSGDDQHNPRENFDGVGLFNRDLNSKVIRLDETEYGKQPNWCRGIDVDGDRIAVTVDGLYGSDLSFKLVVITQDGALVSTREVRWESIGDVANLRYVTGFDIGFV